MSDPLEPFHQWTKGRPAIDRSKAASAAALRTDRPRRARAPTMTAARPVFGDLDLAAPSSIFVGSPVEIATALSRLARFNGWGPRFYSVAEHSILCDEIARADGVPARLSPGGPDARRGRGLCRRRDPAA